MIFKKKKLSKLLDLEEEICPSTYCIDLEKGKLGISIMYIKKKYLITKISNKKLKEKINLKDILLKINDTDITNMKLIDIKNLCSKLNNKEKKLQIMHRIY